MQAPAEQKVHCRGSLSMRSRRARQSPAALAVAPDLRDCTRDNATALMRAPPDATD